MKPSEFFLTAVAMIKARRPLLVKGAPGIGKTDIITQAAAACDADIILSHPAVSDPTDAKGLPWVVRDAKGKTEHATFLPFGELQRAIDATKTTVWFLDDLGQATAAVQASFMQLLLARRVNGHVLPDCVTFIAATNRRTDRAGVSGILEPVKSRFASIVELEADGEEHAAWALDRGWSAEVISFLRFKPDLLSDFKASADLVNSPSPRTWSHVDQILRLQLPSSIQHQMIAGAVGEGAASEFGAFLKLWSELPNVDQILLDPKSVKVPTNVGTLYALSGALAARTTPVNFPQVAQFSQKMVDAGKGEFAVLTIRDAQRRHPEIVRTQAFIKLAVTDLGALVSGQVK